MAKRILFVSQEIAPYVPETDMATVGKLLPQKIQEAGYEIRTFMPKWGIINERRGQLHEVIRLSGMNIAINEIDYPLIIKVASIPSTRIQVYFIDNDEYFQKQRASDLDADYNLDINGERVIFFARGVLETIKKLRWEPDLIVCQGWISSLIPLYLKKAYNDEPMFQNTKVASLVCNHYPNSELNKELKHFIEFKGVKSKTLSHIKTDCMGYQDLTKLGIDYSDLVLLESDNMDKEIEEYVGNQKDKQILKFSSDTKLEETVKFIDSLMQ